MTFVIAQITDTETGRLSLLSDTKVTVKHDERTTRQIYTNACQKVVIVDDDVVVGFAGDTPSSALKYLVGLRGLAAEDIVERLADHSGELGSLRGVSKSFIVAKRAPEPKLWEVSNGEIDDRTAIGTAWAGDRAAFRAFSGFYHESLAFLAENKQRRLVQSVQCVVGLDDIQSVGGYVVRVSGDCSNPFRFFGDPAGTGPWLTNIVVSETSGQKTLLQVTVPPGIDPSQHLRIPIPGAGPTFSALAQYIPEINRAWLHTHEEPWSDPIGLKVSSVTELIEVALADHQQFLQTPDSPKLRRFLGLDDQPENQH